MYDAKIFKDLKGIFSWIEERKKLKGQIIDNYVPDAAETLKEVFDFIGVESTPVILS